MQVTIEINGNNPLEAAGTKMAIEKIAKNFDSKNLKKIAELSEIKDANSKIEKLFNNPLFKMAL